jgi:4-amino-4-deoxy-L-arabinose transferase-like glycosyltransferase
MERWWLWPLALIIALGAVLRLYHLDSVPPGFQFDEAYNAIDAVHVQQGEWRIFFPANGGREPLYTYWQALLFATWGPNLFALRLASAVVGILTLPLAFGATRYLFRPALAGMPATAVALLTTGFLAFSFWHLHFSHYAIRAVMLPAILLVTLWLFWWGQTTGRRLPFALSGVGLAAGVYAHPAGRLAPFLLALFVLYDVAFARRRARPQVLGLALAGAVSLTLFLPLGIFFVDHPWLFTGHPTDVSVFDPSVNGGHLAATLGQHALALAGMLVWRGDLSWLHNLPGRPAFEPLTGLLGVLGVLVWVVGILSPSRLLTGSKRRAAAQQLGPSPELIERRHPEPAAGRRPFAYLAFWIAVMVVPSLLSDNPPNFSRAIGALPAICTLPALGVIGVWYAFRRVTSFRAAVTPIAVALAALVLATAAAWTARDYYLNFAQHREAYYWYDADKEEVADILQDLAARGQVYMAPPWVKHATVAFLTRADGIKEIALGTGVVIPDPARVEDAYYVLRADDAGESRFVSRRLGPPEEEWTEDDRYGNLLLFIHHLPTTALTSGVPGPEQPMQATFGDIIRLQGYTVNVDVEEDGRIDILFYWKAVQSAPINYTQFVHLVDESGQGWGQRDREPLDTTYRTTEWQPGDTIIDRFRVEVDPDAPAGRYTLLTGWYNLDTGVRLPAVVDGSRVAGDQLSLSEIEIP